MYTQRLENPHNALWESRAEWIPASRQKDGARSWSIHSFILEELVHGVIQRNTTQVQINCKLTIRVYTSFPWQSSR